MSAARRIGTPRRRSRRVVQSIAGVCTSFVYLLYNQRPLIFPSSDRAFAEAARSLLYGNPFLGGRALDERRALGRDFHPAALVWISRGAADDPRLERPNLRRLRDRSWDLACAARETLEGIRGDGPTRDDLLLYEDLALFALYARTERGLYELGVCQPSRWRHPVRLWAEEFERDWRHLMEPPDRPLPSRHSAAGALAWFFQMRRAVHHLFHCVVGDSGPSTALRADAWRSLFTHDMRRWRRALVDRMGDVPTLILGVAPAGKRDLAQALALSGHVRFDRHRGAFEHNGDDMWRSVALAGLRGRAVESALFGHVKGALPGAVRDRQGGLDRRPPHGCVYLDEVGELDGRAQISLLGALRTRIFERLGETDARVFEGKLLAATARDLDADVREGRFLPDLAHRLASDRLRMPTLRERLDDDPDELRKLTRRLAGDLIGDGPDADLLADEAAERIGVELGPDHPWSADLEELDRHVRSVLVRRRCAPSAPPAAAPLGGADPLARALATGEMSADALLDAYCARVVKLAGGWSPAARRLGLDRRTVKARAQRAGG